jgi:hypothetical protein
VLATGPKGCGFRSGRSDGFLRVIKIRSTPCFGWEIKPEVPCRKILQHVKDPLRYFRYWQNPHSFVHSSYSLQMSLVVGLPASSGRRVRSYSQPALSPPRLSADIHPRDVQYASDGCCSETSVSPHHN